MKRELPSSAVWSSAPEHRSGVAGASPSLRGLGSFRLRHRLIQVGIAGWGVTLAAWLLPLSSWSAVRLPPSMALTTGALFAAVGALLVLAQRGITRSATDLTSRVAAYREPGAAGVAEARPLGVALPDQMSMGLVAVLLLTAPVLRMAGAALVVEALAWLLHPLAALVSLQPRRERAVWMLAVASLITIATAELWMPSGDPRSAVALQTCWLLTAAVALWAGRLTQAPDAMARASVSRAALDAKETRFQALVQHATDVVIVLRADGTRRYVSPSVTRVLGWTPERMVRGDLFDLVHPDDVAEMMSFFVELVTTAGATGTIECRWRDHDGSWRNLESAFSNLLDDPNIGGIVVTSRDVTARKQFEARLAHQALHDALTGLPNRRLFQERLDRALAGDDRQGVAVLFIDLDRFKSVNDTLGHEAGDELLTVVAQRLTGCVREGDTVARVGGDEFVALLTGVTQQDEAQTVAERMLTALRQTFVIQGEPVSIGASIGVVNAAGTPASGADVLLRQADAAMYRAKTAGRDRVIVFVPEDVFGGEREEAELRAALANEELQLFYQPVVDLQTGMVVAMEALLRWRHPQRGLLTAREFLSLAERTGLIVPIGEWTLRSACRQARIWMDRQPDVAPRVVSVNLGSRQLLDSGLIGQVRSALASSDLPAQVLRLEVSEDSAVRHEDAIRPVLNALRTMGVGVALDRFGATHASLRLLQRLPVDAVIVDPSLLSDTDPASEQAVMMHAVTMAAHSIGARVTVAGIENAAQYGVVRASQATAAQGYFVAMPAPPEPSTDGVVMGRSAPFVPQIAAAS